MTETEKALHQFDEWKHFGYCAKHTPKPQYIKDAHKALVEKTEAENPEPLTLDELRRMDGEPVWIKHIMGEWRFNGWNIVDRNSEIFSCFENYGITYFAYRHKPKEVQNEMCKVLN